MVAREALRELVDDIAEEDIADVYEFAQMIAKRRSALRAIQLQRGPGIVMSGREFFSAPPKDAETLAREQGVKPIKSIDDPRGDFWPEDESADEFVETIRQWRREGGGG
jgi:hypothetical protein